MLAHPSSSWLVIDEPFFHRGFSATSCVYKSQKSTFTAAKYIHACIPPTGRRRQGCRSRRRPSGLSSFPSQIFRFVFPRSLVFLCTTCGQRKLQSLLLNSSALYKSKREKIKRRKLIRSDKKERLTSEMKSTLALPSSYTSPSVSHQ